MLPLKEAILAAERSLVFVSKRVKTDERLNGTAGSVYNRLE
jgi:hypothetical protein